MDGAYMNPTLHTALWSHCCLARHDHAVWCATNRLQSCDCGVSPRCKRKTCLLKQVAASYHTSSSKGAPLLRRWGDKGAAGERASGERQAQLGVIAIL